MGRLQRYYNSGRPFSISFILAGSFERVNRLAGRSTGKDQAGRVLIYIYICTLATNRYRSVGSAPVDSSLITNQGQDVVLARGGSIRQGGKRTVRSRINAGLFPTTNSFQHDWLGEIKRITETLNSWSLFLSFGRVPIQRNSQKKGEKTDSEC